MNDSENNSHPLTPADELARVVRFGRRAARFYPAALAIFLSVVAATLVFDRVRKREYHSETVLEYRDSIRLGSGDGGGDPARKLGLSLKELLYSRQRLGKVVKDLRLYPRMNPVEAEEEMAKHLAFKISGDTFSLAFNAPRPEIAQAVVTRLSSDLMAENQKQQSEQAKQTHDFLQSEITHDDEVLKKLEADAAQFIARHPEYSQSGPVATSMTPAPSVEEAAAPAPAHDDGGALMALQIQAAQQGPLAAQQAARVARQRDAMAAMQAATRDLNDKLALFTDKHPDVIAAKRSRDEAKAALDRANADVAAGSQGALHEQLAAVSKIGGGASTPTRRKAKARALSPSEELAQVTAETQWAQLSRDVAEARERRNQLAQKLFVAALAVNSVDNHLAIVDPAYLPHDPLPPGRMVVFGGGLLLALLLSIGFALLRALLDDRLYERDDVVRLGVGSISEAVANHEPITSSASGSASSRPDVNFVDRWAVTSRLPRFLKKLVAPPESAQSAGFRVLRFRLGAAGDPRIIMVASAGAREGSMRCAVNLAAAIAEHGHARVVLIDANTRRRPLLNAADNHPLDLDSEAQTIDSPDDPEVPASSEVGMELYYSAARKIVPVRLITLPRPSPGESIDAAAFADVCHRLLDSVCDYLVIDAPPVLGSADANFIAQAADGVLLSTRAGLSSSRGVRSAAEQLAPVRILGVTLLPA